jgi:hypothetical protein
MVFFNGKEITQIVLNNKQINLLNKNEKEISLQQKLDNYSYDEGVPLNGDKTLRSVPVDLCYLFDVLDEDGPGGENKPIVWLEDEEGNAINIKINIGGSELETYKKETIEKEIYPNQTRTCVDVYETVDWRLLKKLTLGYGKKYWLYGYDSYKDYCNKENFKTFGSIKTKNKQSLSPSKTIYINNYPQTAEEFKKTNYCTIQQAFRELENKEGTYTIELVETNIPYQGLLYYKGKANIIIKGNGQTISAENCGVLNNDEHKRSCFEWAGTGNIILQNVKLENTYTRDEYGNDNSAGEVFGMTSGNVIAIDTEFDGWQDTIRLVGHGYFKDCTIKGDVDYIWAESGFDAAYFEDCTLVCKADYYRDSPTSCIVAPRMTMSKIIGKGLVFKNCEIKIQEGCKTYLGRNPWESYNSWYNNATFINCNINSKTSDEPGSSCMYDLVNNVETYFRTSMWNNAATSLGDYSKVGYKTYGLTLNGHDGLNTQIIKKTTTYQNKTFVNGVEKNHLTKSFGFTFNLTGECKGSTSYYSKYRRFKYSNLNLNITNIVNTLALEDVNGRFEVKIGWPYNYANGVDTNKSSPSTEDRGSCSWRYVTGYVGNFSSINKTNITNAFTTAINVLTTTANINNSENGVTMIKDGYVYQIAGLIPEKSNNTYTGWVYDILSEKSKELGTTVNGLTIEEYCRRVNKWYAPTLVIKRTINDASKYYYIPLTGSTMNKTKSFSYSRNYVDTSYLNTDETDSEEEDPIISYEMYTGDYEEEGTGSWIISTNTENITEGSTTTTYTTTVRRYRTVVRELIDYKMENCPELTEEEVNTEFTGPNNILNRVYDGVNEEYTTSPIKWTDYKDYIDYTDDSDCGSDDNIKAWIFGVNAFSDTYQYGGTTNGTIENNNGDKLTVDCSETSTAKISSEGRGNDIQMNVGAKIYIPTNSGDTVIVNCYPGYKASLSGGTSSQTIEQVSSGGSLVLTVDSNSYIMSIYIISKS